MNSGESYLVQTDGVGNGAVDEVIQRLHAHSLHHHIDVCLGRPDVPARELSNNKNKERGGVRMGCAMGVCVGVRIA